MAVSNYIGTNVVSTDTFAGWIDKTNQVRHDMGTIVVTVGSVAQPNTTNGAETTGNAHIEGILSANTFAVASQLRGGTVSTPADLTISSNAVFGGANVDINSNTTINGTIASITANLSITDASIDINSTSFVANTSNYHLSSANAVIDGNLYTLNSTDAVINSNTTVNGIIAMNANVTIGSNTSDILNVLGYSSFAGNTTFNDLVTMNANVIVTAAHADIQNNLTIGSANTDTVTVNSKIGSTLLPTASTIDFGAATLPWGNVYASYIHSDGNIQAEGSLIVRGGVAQYVIAQSSTTSYQNLELQLKTSTGNTKTPLVLNSTSIYPGANVTYDFGTVTDYFKTGYFQTLEVSTNETIQGTLTVNTQANTASLMVRDLTATRVTYAGTGGELIDSGVFTFNGSTLSVPNISLSGNVSATGTVSTGNLTATGTTTLSGPVNVSGLTTHTANVEISTGNYLNFGNTMIYSETGISYGGSANVEITALTDILIKNGVNHMASFIPGGSVDLYNNGTLKFATQSYGVSVSGETRTTTANVASTSSFGGLATFSNGITVTGAASLATLSTSGLATLSSANVVGATRLGGDITAIGRIISTNATQSTNTSTGAIHTTGGIGVSKDAFFGANAHIASDLTVTGTIHSMNETLTNNLNVANSATISGDLVVLGNTTFNSNVQLSIANSQITDLTINNSLSMFTGATVATSLIPSGNGAQNLGSATSTWGDVYANNVIGTLDWANVSNQPDPTITVSLTGDVAGSSSTTLTNLTNGAISIAATIQPNSVALGTDTTGAYVSTITAGGAMTVTGSGTETAGVTVSHADTSTVANVSVNNSGGTVIQDISATFDTYGHVTSMATQSYNLDNRYAQTAFKNIAVGATTVVADQIADTLTLTSGSGISLAANATTDTVTVTSTDTLATVTGRGSTTTNSITVGNLTAANGAFSGNVTIAGDLTINGTTTYVNTTTLSVADNIIDLNSDVTGAPTQSAGINVVRGTSTNKTFLWDETNDYWTVGSETFVAGTVIGNLTGNASTATKLATTRTIALTGDISGSATFDGTANATISATIQPNSVALGTDTTGNYADSVSAGNNIVVAGTAGEGTTFTVSTSQSPTFTTSVTAPIFYDSSNASFYGDFAGTSILNGLTVASTITGSVSGNAGTATKLATPRTITLTGDVSGSATFDGTANASISATIQPNSVALGTDTTGNYVSNITAGSNILVSGTGSENANVTVSVSGNPSFFAVDATKLEIASTGTTGLLGLTRSDAPLDEKGWYFSSSLTGVFNINSRSDAGTFGESAYRIYRNGTSITKHALLINTSEIFTVNSIGIGVAGDAVVTGDTTVSGNVSVTGNMSVSAPSTITGTLGETSLVVARPYQDTSGTPVMVVAGDGEVNDVLLEVRANANGAAVDVSSNSASSNDAVFNINGLGDIWTSRNISADGTITAQGNITGYGDILLTKFGSPGSANVYYSGSGGNTAISLGESNISIYSNGSQKAFIGTTGLQVNANVEITGQTTVGASGVKFSDASVQTSASPFSKSYDSGNTSWTTGLSISFAHGLGTSPKFLRVVGVITSPYKSFSVGEEIELPTTTNSNGNQGLGVSSTSTNIIVGRPGISAVQPEDSYGSGNYIVDWTKTDLRVYAWA